VTLLPQINLPKSSHFSTFTITFGGGGDEPHTPGKNAKESGQV